MNWGFLWIWAFEIQIGSLGNLFFDKGLSRALLIWKKKETRKRKAHKTFMILFHLRNYQECSWKNGPCRLPWRFTSISDFWLFLVSSVWICVWPNRIFLWGVDLMWFPIREQRGEMNTSAKGCREAPILALEGTAEDEGTGSRETTFRDKWREGLCTRAWRLIAVNIYRDINLC